MGEAHLKLTLAKNGMAQQIQILKSSGRPELDQVVIDAVKSAQPFDPFQNYFQTTDGIIQIQIPIDFKLLKLNNQVSYLRK